MPNVDYVDVERMVWKTTFSADDVLQRQMAGHIEINLTAGFATAFFKPAAANKSIMTIRETVPGPGRIWRGLAVATAVCPDEKDRRDLHMVDFRRIANHFISIMRWSSWCIPAVQPSLGSQESQASRINSPGDCQTLGRPHFEAASFPEQLGYAIAGTVTNISQVSDLVGLSIRTLAIPSDLRWLRDGVRNRKSLFRNPDGASLHVRVDPKEILDPYGIDWAALNDPTFTGSILVIRPGAEPLDTLDVEALCAYCQYDVQPLLAQTKVDYGPQGPRERGFMKQCICPRTLAFRKIQTRHKKETR